MTSASLLAELPSGPVSSIDEAIARMTAISEALSPRDGLACFNRMYCIVTERVRAEVASGRTYADPAFMTHLDVVFVNLYLSALDAFRYEPETSPRCWSELFESHADPRITRMQFAVAGMSAHINHDLPIAVVKTCQDLGKSPDRGSHADDYDNVNAILGSLEQSIRESFETGVILDLDRRTARVENIFENLAIHAARRAAWLNAMALWHLREDLRRSREYIEALDVSASLAGRGLLVPVL
jgi:hypothetical protein